MRKNIKSFLQKILGENQYLRFMLFLKSRRNIFYLITNTWEDFILYYKHSTVFRNQGLRKKEAQLILDYHSIEKGMLFYNMKPRFAQNRVERLHQTISSIDLHRNIGRSQIEVTLKILCKYYEMHQLRNINIEDYFPHSLYKKYKALLKNHYSEKFCGAIEYTNNDLYENINKSFEVFAFSRKSVRDFTGEKIKKDIIRQAIDLALSAPSVCNRQANTIYLIEDKSKIDSILDIQGGFRGYDKNVHQLLILTNDRNYYYTVGERNQFYIDGGVFLMNLLYSLFYFKIASCPANWGKMMKDEKRLKNIITIPESEKIICLIPIGVAQDKFRVTLSKRRNLDEIFIEL